MEVSTPEVVSLLLDNGANPLKTDIGGINCIHFAATFARTDNMELWLQRFPEWDLDTRDKGGSFALSMAVYQGPRRLEVVKFLLGHGASLDTRADMGFTAFRSSCSSADSDGCWRSERGR